MRVIKFRAYNRLLKQMFPVKVWEGRYIWGFDYSQGDNPYEKVHDLEENTTLMQFTGLSDCSNSPIDIYEGDIIKVTHFREWGEEIDMISPVIFESGVFALKQRHIDEGEVCPLSCEEYYTVIGNIFENPELLKRNNV